MAIFNRKEFEILQAENTALKDKIATLEVRLSARNTALSEYKNKVEELEELIEDYQHKLSNSYSSHKVKQVRQGYEEHISALEKEIDTLQNRPHNERGAGRKHKATPAQTDYILSLFSQGISQNKIAQMMTEQTGGKWNKTTIRNIIIRAKK